MWCGAVSLPRPRWMGETRIPNRRPGGDLLGTMLSLQVELLALFRAGRDLRLQIGPPALSSTPVARTQHIALPSAATPAHRRDAEPDQQTSPQSLPLSLN